MLYAMLIAGAGIRPLTLEEYPVGLTPSDLAAWAHRGLSPLYLSRPYDSSSSSSSSGPPSPYMNNNRDNDNDDDEPVMKTWTNAIATAVSTTTAATTTNTAGVAVAEGETSGPRWVAIHIHPISTHTLAKTYTHLSIHLAKTVQIYQQSTYPINTHTHYNTPSQPPLHSHLAITLLITYLITYPPWVYLSQMGTRVNPISTSIRFSRRHQTFSWLAVSDAPRGLKATSQRTSG